MKKYLIIFFACLLVSCSGSGGDRQGTDQSITGIWYSDCVESSSLPFPPTTAVYFLSGYVTVEVNFNGGNVTADGVLHDDNTCSSTEIPTRFFDGTYTVGGKVISPTNEEVNTIRFVGDDGLFFVSYDYETYFVIENEILYVSDVLTTDINIRRDVPYSR